MSLDEIVTLVFALGWIAGVACMTVIFSVALYISGERK